VRDTFHTAIHRYQINGENYWANASDPEIPIALAPVIIGIATLHNFPSKPAHNVNGSPQVHELSPSDIATIYNLTPLYEAGIDGSRTSIAVIGDGNLNLQDVIDFRKLFGLPYNPPEIILNGVQPGQLGPVTKEAVLDASWTGAIATNAAIKFVLSTSTNTTNTQDLSEEYIVENNLADVVSESLVNCEHEVTAAHAAELAQFREQAAAQGMTFVVSTGDSGPYGCANFDTAKTVTNSDVVSVNARAS
jgi:subtilase family serine protease